MRSKNSLSVITIVSLFMIFSISCNKDNEIKSYKEKIQKTKPSVLSHGHGVDISRPTKSDLKWDIPEGWTSIKANSKLRLATYSIKSGGKEAICTVVPLSGDAGGLKANIQMWLASTSEKNLSEEELKKFISKQEKFKTKDGKEGIFIDFSEMTGKEPDLTIGVSVITYPKKTLFIKMTGNIGVVKSNKDKMLKLSKSIEQVK